MSIELALRATEILLACAVLQHSLEHLRDRDTVWIFSIRMVAALGLIAGTGVASLVSLSVLSGISLVLLHTYRGPFNGGSDRMAHLITWCLLAVELAPTPAWQDLAFGYLAMQVTLSYAVSGWVKLRNPEWRSGQALTDVFAFSAYPVAEIYRRFAERQSLMRSMSWLVIGFELVFPIGFLSATLLATVLVIAALFHTANACLFGLNRFLWIWIAAYPSLFWLQARLVGGA